MPAGGDIATSDVPAVPSVEDPDAMGAFIQDQTSTSITKPKLAMKVATAEADGQVYGANNADSRIVLKATAPVWLRIEDAIGNVLITQMLGTGDTYKVPNKEGLIALSRDGGRISYMIDGQTKGTLGPAGKILVGEKLDIASLEGKK